MIFDFIFISILTTVLIISAISLKSSSTSPLVVKAGDPRRIPLVTKGDNVSKGIVFLFAVMPISSRTVCAVLPVIPIALISANSTCVSVPPEITRTPRFCNSSDKTFSFFFTCFAYSLNAGERSSPKATAFAAMTCSNGPPACQGKQLYQSLSHILPYT